MDFFELGCSCLEAPYLKAFMDTVGYLGRGITAPAVGLALIAFGYFGHRATIKRTGWAVLAALLVTALLVNLLKILLQMPRPTPRSGYGFPSGDSGTAFSFATVIGSAFPALAPILFLLATLTSVSRLYFRAHYVWDILGGAGIGIICGKSVASRMLPPACSWWRSRPARLIWSGTGLVAIASALFFLLLEAKIAEHKRSESFIRAATGPRMIIAFGTPAAQPHLLKGWSRNELWRDPQLTINWVEGLDASLAVPVNSTQDFLLLLRAYPYRPKGFLCQWAELNVADRRVGRIYLEQDWNTYEIELPKESVTKGENRFDFRFRYTDNANWHGVNPDHKPLSVAFNLMQLSAE